jgi:hypothetical protein
MSDKKISELPLASAINPNDISVLVSDGTDYQFAFTTLLQLIGSSLSFGANISFGSTLPQNNIGKNNDVFINTNTGSFAQKLSGTWSVVYTLPTSGSITDGTVLYGLGAPGVSTGNNNDTYINTGTGVFYKKTASSWNQVFSIQTGPQGAHGIAGANGTDGTNGYSILSGNSNPSNLSAGANGDFYINTINYTFFGPKTSGDWGSGISLIGIGIEQGGTTGQVLAKHSNTDYDTEWISFEDILGYTPENIANKGIANGYAPLNSSTKIDAAFLPSYVSDIVTSVNLAALPSPGTAGFIYITADNNKEYRWNAGTSAYIELVPSPGTTDALAEGVTNLYYTDARVATYGNAHYLKLSGSGQTVSQTVDFTAAVSVDLRLSVMPTGVIGLNFGALQNFQPDYSIYSSGDYKIGLDSGGKLLFYRVGYNIIGGGIIPDGQILFNGSFIEDGAGVNFVKYADTSGNLEIDGHVITATNLGGVSLSGFYNTNSFGKLIIGQNRSSSLGETDFISAAGTDPFAKGGFRFSVVDTSGTESLLLDINGDTKSATFGGIVIPGSVASYGSTGTVYLTLDATTGAIVKRPVSDFSGGGGSDTNIYNSDGSLTGLRSFDINQYGLYIYNNDGTNQMQSQFLPSSINLSVYNEAVTSGSSLYISRLSGVFGFAHAGGGETRITLDDGITIKDTVNSMGAVYLDDYSANYTDRSLVDKGYVDDAVISGGINIYNTNGTLLGDRVVSIGTHNLKFDANTGPTTNTYQNINNNSIQLFSESATDIGAQVLVTGNEVLLSAHDNTGGAKSAFILIRPTTPILVNDDIASTGMMYAADYSENYEDRSLVDKAYVDSVAGSNNIYNTDGTITGNRTVTTGGYTLSFSNTKSAIEIADNSAVMVHYHVDTGIFTASEIQVSDDAILMEVSDSISGNSVGITMDNSVGINITDQIFAKGMLYAADYSANYTSRSLVDKAYVDAAISGIGGSGISALTGDVTASGTGSVTATIGAGKVTNAMLAGSIAASKLIATDIGTVGTIAAGTWNGTAIADTYIASASTWNGKISTIAGITAGGDLSGTYPNPTVTNAAVIGKLLTGLSISGSTITATDSILTAFGKLQSQVTGLAGAITYQGTWNASTNSPTLASGVGTKGFLYKVSTAGTTTLDGISQWNVGDQVVFNGTTWDKIDGVASEVVSFNTRVGTISLTTADVNAVSVTALGIIATGVWQGTAIADTYISSASTWNSKISTISGIAAGGDLGGTYPSPTINNGAVIAKTLTGYTAGAGIIASTDSILQAIQKLDGNIGAIGNVVFSSSNFGGSGTSLSPYTIIYDSTPTASSLFGVTSGGVYAMVSGKVGAASPTLTGTVTVTDTASAAITLSKTGSLAGSAGFYNDGNMHFVADSVGGGLMIFSAPTSVSFRGSSGGSDNVVFPATGGIQLNNLTASSAVFTDSSKNLVSVTNTGTGNNVLSISPILKGLIVTAVSLSAINSTATATVAQLATGVITSTSAAATTITLPTATLLATQLGAVRGTTFEFTVDNSAGANTVTMALGTGTTALSAITGGGTLTVASGVVAVFRYYFTGTTAAKFYRIG